MSKMDIIVKLEKAINIQPQMVMLYPIGYELLQEAQFEIDRLRQVLKIKKLRKTLKKNKSLTRRKTK